MRRGWRTGGTGLRSLRSWVPLWVLAAAAVLAPAAIVRADDVADVAAVTAANAAFDETDGIARAAVMAPDYVEVHASGWRYDKHEALTFARNNRDYPVSAVVIKRSSTVPTVNVYNGDTAVVTASSETYYAVPNEEDLAIAAGTHARDIGAVGRWLCDQQSPLHAAGPGEAVLPNPYRTRSVRVWIRTGGRLIVFARTSRIGPRGSSVLLAEQRQ